MKNRVGCTVNGKKNISFFIANADDGGKFRNCNLKTVSFVLISISIALCNFAAEIFIFVGKHSNYTFNPCLQK